MISGIFLTLLINYHPALTHPVIPPDFFAFNEATQELCNMRSYDINGALVYESVVPCEHRPETLGGACDLVITDDRESERARVKAACPDVE